MKVLLVVVVVALLGAAVVHGELECEEPCVCRTEEASPTNRTLVNVVDCSNKGEEISSVPNFNALMEVAIESMLLNGNAIPSLMSYAFHGLNVRKMDFNDNRINSVSDNTFKNLGGLQELYLANNRLNQVPLALNREELSGLKKLDLSNNSISNLANDIFQHMTNLEYLDLSHNPVIMTANFAAFEPLVNLKYLNLADARLAHVPMEALSDTPKLERLILRKNRISLFPQLLSDHVPGLTELDISENPISFPSEQTLFQNFPNLTVLKMSGCELGSIELHTFQDVKKLTNLTVRNCNVETVAPQVLKDFHSLRSLDLSANPFTVTDELITGIEDTLELMVLDDMGFTEYPKDMIERLTLREVHLENNDISGLGRDIFDNFDEPDIHVYLANNQINSISSKVMDGAPKPVHLHLENNNLTNLNFYNAEPCQYDNSILDVTGNNIDCNCHTLKTVQQKVADLRGVCATPEKYRGLKLHYRPENPHNGSYKTNQTTAEDQATRAELASQYFEIAALEDCGLSDRSNYQFSCTCKSWETFGNGRVCELTSASDTVRGAFIITLNLVMVLIPTAVVHS